jgi:hypothetical protein
MARADSIVRLVLALADDFLGLLDDDTVGAGGEPFVGDDPLVGDDPPVGVVPLDGDGARTKAGDAGAPPCAGLNVGARTSFNCCPLGVSHRQVEYV